MNDLGLPPLEEMAEEHEAWIGVCRRIERTLNSDLTTITGNAPTVDDPRWKPVLAQIKYWGETLHQLRLANPKYDTKAYAEAKEVAQE